MIKVLKYTCNGPMSMPVSRCGMKNTVRHSAWEKRTVKQLERIGMPNIPIQKVHKIRIEIRFPNHQSKYGNNETAQTIIDMLANAGVIAGVYFRHIKKSEYENKFNEMNPGFTVWLFLRDDEIKNKGVNFDFLPVITDK